MKWNSVGTEMSEGSKKDSPGIGEDGSQEWTEVEHEEQDSFSEEDVREAEKKVIDCIAEVSLVGFEKEKIEAKAKKVSEDYLQHKDEGEVLKLLKMALNSVYEEGNRRNFENQVRAIHLVEALLKYNTVVGIDDTEIRQDITIYTGPNFEKLLHHPEYEEKYNNVEIRRRNNGIMYKLGRRHSENKFAHLLNNPYSVGLPKDVTVRYCSKEVGNREAIEDFSLTNSAASLGESVKTARPLLTGSWSLALEDHGRTEEDTLLTRSLASVRDVSNEESPPSNNGFWYYFKLIVFFPFHAITYPARMIISKLSSWSQGYYPRREEQNFYKQVVGEAAEEGAGSEQLSDEVKIASRGKHVGKAAEEAAGSEQLSDEVKIARKKAGLKYKSKMMAEGIRGGKLYRKLDKMFHLPERVIEDIIDKGSTDSVSFIKAYTAHLEELEIEYSEGSPPGYTCLSFIHVDSLQRFFWGKDTWIDKIKNKFPRIEDEEGFEAMKKLHNDFRSKVGFSINRRFQWLDNHDAKDAGFPGNKGTVAEYDLELPEGRGIKKVKEKHQHLDLETFSAKRKNKTKEIPSWIVNRDVSMASYLSFRKRFNGIENEFAELQKSVDVDLSLDSLDKKLEKIEELSYKARSLDKGIVNTFPSKKQETKDFLKEMKKVRDSISSYGDKVWKIYEGKFYEEEKVRDKVTREWKSRHKENEPSEEDIDKVLKAEKKVALCMAVVVKYYFDDCCSKHRTYEKDTCISLKKLSDEEAKILLKRVLKRVYKQVVKNYNPCGFVTQVASIKVVEALLEYNEAAGIDDSEIRKDIRIYTGEKFGKLLYYPEYEEEYAGKKVRPTNDVMSVKAKVAGEHEDSVDPHLLHETLPIGITVLDHSKKWSVAPPSEQLSIPIATSAAGQGHKMEDEYGTPPNTPSEALPKLSTIYK